MGGAVLTCQPAVADAGGPHQRWSRLLLLAAATFHTVGLVTLLAWATLPILFGWDAAVITSGSMQPRIRPGDVVLVDPSGTVDIGQVVTFAAADGRSVTHRIVGRSADGWATRGDANRIRDAEPVPADRVTGPARVLVPLVGTPALWHWTGRTILAVMWAIVATLAAMFAAPDRPRARSGPQPVRPRPRRLAAAVLLLAMLGLLRVAAVGACPACSATPAGAGTVGRTPPTAGALP